MPFSDVTARVSTSVLISVLLETPMPAPASITRLSTVIIPSSVRKILPPVIRDREDVTPKVEIFAVTSIPPLWVVSPIIIVSPYTLLSS